MFIIRNRDEYREYLLSNLERTKKESNESFSDMLPHARDRRRSHLLGIIYGLELALDGLNDWIKQTSNETG